MHRSKREITLGESTNSITSVDNFLPGSISHRMSEIAQGGKWSPSPVAPVPGTDRIPAATGRSSSTLMAASLGLWFRAQVQHIETSLERSGVAPSNLEPWQLTRYLCGETYDYHLDCGAWRDHPSGDRKRTIMLYLQKPERGGATHFRALNQTIEPLAGRLVVWYNLLPNGNCNHAMIHAGLPVLRGCKMILTTWERQTRFVHQRK